MLPRSCCEVALRLPTPSWFLHCLSTGEFLPELSGDADRGPGSSAMFENNPTIATVSDLVGEPTFLFVLASLPRLPVTFSRALLAFARGTQRIPMHAPGVS